MIKGRKLFFTSSISLSLILIFILPSFCLAQETRAEMLLSQADVFYIQGNYEQARTLYLEVIKITDRKMHLSRAFFGLSLCSFNLGDEGSTRIYLRKLFSIDPQKEISALFYPQAFLKIFQEVKQEYLSGEKKDLPGELGEKKMEEKEAESTLNQKKEGESTRTKEKAPGPEIGAMEPKVVKSPYLLGGHWEIDLHYSRWGLEPVLSLFEKSLKKRIGAEVREEITEYLSSRYGSLTVSSYDQQLLLQVEGWNEGFGLRYFSKGASGSFSLGIYLERTHLRFKSSGSIRQDYSNGSSAEVEAEAFLQADPVCGHISFRWDFNPRSRLSPYFVFGLGFGPLNGRMGYSYTGIYKFYGYQESIRDSQDKSFKEWQQEEDSHIHLEKIILLQACFGLRLELFRSLSFLLETGLWDGFLVRGGLAFRL